MNAHAPTPDEHPLRVRQAMLAQADAENALRDAIDALDWAALTASIARLSDRTTLAVMHHTAETILEGLQ